MRANSCGLQVDWHACADGIEMHGICLQYCGETQAHHAEFVRDASGWTVAQMPDELENSDSDSEERCSE